MYSTKNDYVIVWNISSTLNAVLCSILRTTEVKNELRVIIKVMCRILTGCKTKSALFLTDTVVHVYWVQTEVQINVHSAYNVDGLNQANFLNFFFGW